MREIRLFIIFLITSLERRLLKRRSLIETRLLIELLIILNVIIIIDIVKTIITRRKI